MFLSYNLKFCLKLTLLILIFFSLLNNSWSDEKIGSVTNINGYVISIDKKGNEKELSIYDPVFLDEEIFVSDSSSVTIQYGDNTTIILKEFTSFNVNDFENSEVRKKFKAEVKKGEIVIESGSIAKASDGDMLIDVSKLSLGVRGTRLNIEIDQNENPKVGLSEDSFGNVGEISLTSENQTTNLNEAEQLVEFNQNNEVTKREQTLDEKQEFENVQETLIEISKIDENSLDLQLEQKLQDGKLEDANNDGIVNSRDIEVVKENIKTEKKANLDFIVENSGADNTNFLSDVLDQSDEKNIGETMTKIIEIKDNIIEDVVGNLSDKENTFITSSASQEIVEVKEKIFETIVAKETDKSAEILSKVMAKSDEGTIASVITNITEKNTNEDSTLSLKVMADFSENSPEKLEAYAETNSEQIEILSIDAVQKASVSNEDVDLIAKVVAVVNDKIANIVVEEVSKSSSEEKQSLSAKVFQAIVETEPDKMDIINTEVRDLMIEQTIDSAKNQEEGTYTEEENLADIVASIIVNTNAEIATQFIEEVNEIETETNLSLKVISGISEKDSERIDILSEFNKEQMNQLTIDAVQNAENTSEDSQLIANVVSVINNDLINIMVEEVSKVSTDEKQTLSAKVLQAIVETEPDKMDIINNEIKDVMIEQTVESAKNQSEGTGIQEQEDFTDIVSDIIVNTDSETAEKIINELNDVNTESNLSLEVISGISEKDENKLNELSENIKDEMNELTIDAVQNAENTSEDSQLIANVVSVINNDLINIMVEEVSKVSTDEKQTLSAKVLQAIVETEPDKMDIINNEIKDVMIEQTVESAKNQSEGTGIQEQEDFTDIVSDIIVNTDSETAEKIINELNDVNTESNLSLKVISGISQKDAKKLDELAGNNLEQIEELTTDAVQNAENTSEDSDLIAQVVSVVNDNFANKVVEEVNKAAELDETKDSLSAKVLQAIVDEEPAKIEAISKENKDQLIEDAVDAAKKQKEGDIIDETDYTKIITDVMVNTETETASKILEEVDNIETDSNFKLDFIDVLKEEENFDKTLDILSATSVQNNDAITNIINEAIDKIEDDEDVSKITDILKDSEGSLSEKILDAGNKNKENKEKISEVLKEVAEEDPDKVIEIIENNKNTNEILDAIKDKIENEEAITAEDFSNVFDENVSPN